MFVGLLISKDQNMNLICLLKNVKIEVFNVQQSSQFPYDLFDDCYYFERI